VDQNRNKRAVSTTKIQVFFFFFLFFVANAKQTKSFKTESCASGEKIDTIRTERIYRYEVYKNQFLVYCHFIIWLSFPFPHNMGDTVAGWKTWKCYLASFLCYSFGQVFRDCIVQSASND
jgi:hypothetical protein